jgi:hypothetical protein
MNDNTERIKHTALGYLQHNPDPVPRFLILRDLLHRQSADQELCDAKNQLMESKWVKQLAAEQNENGGWSRFHSMNSKAKHKIPTTEYAVFKARILGLEQADAILTKAQSYCEGLLGGTIPWPEDEEKEPNDRWPVGEEMFVSATLTQIDPQNVLLESVYEKWCQIADVTFSSGSYDPEAEWRAHCRLTGATTMRNSYLVINNRYAQTILSNAGERLSLDTEKALLDWLWKYPRGIGYLNSPLNVPVSDHPPQALRWWFTSHWILYEFRFWREKIKDDVAILWSMQMQDGFWDLGSKASSDIFRLSESWRKQKNRLIDQSIRVLLLLVRYYG